MNEGSLSIYTDGGSRGNPGKSACAFVVIKDGVEIYKDSKFLGIGTNNFAEYQGVIVALKWLLGSEEYKNSDVKFFLDSELVVRQLNGRYKVKNLNLQKLFSEIKEMIKKFDGKVLFSNVPREENSSADALLNETLDAAGN